MSTEMSATTSTQSTPAMILRKILAVKGRRSSPSYRLARPSLKCDENPSRASRRAKNLASFRKRSRTSTMYSFRGATRRSAFRGRFS